MNKKTNVYNERIKRLMREQKKTQQDLSDLLGIAQPTVHQRLASERTFDIEDLLKICGFFKVPLNDFLYEGEDQEKKTAGPILAPEDLLAISTRRHNEILGQISEIRSLVLKCLENQGN